MKAAICADVRLLCTVMGGKPQLRAGFSEYGMPVGTLHSPDEVRQSSE